MTSHPLSPMMHFRKGIIQLMWLVIFFRCSQSEAYERVDEDNGIYMKHLKKHICRDEKIEDILHAVTTGKSVQRHKPFRIGFSR